MRLPSPRSASRILAAPWYSGDSHGVWTCFVVRRTSARGQESLLPGKPDLRRPQRIPREPLNVGTLRGTIRRSATPQRTQLTGYRSPQHSWVPCLLPGLRRGARLRPLSPPLPLPPPPPPPKPASCLRSWPSRRARASGLPRGLGHAALGGHPCSVCRSHASPPGQSTLARASHSADPLARWRRERCGARFDGERPGSHSRRSVTEAFVYPEAARPPAFLLEVCGGTASPALRRVCVLGPCVLRGAPAALR